MGQGNSERLRFVRWLIFGWLCVACGMGVSAAGRVDANTASLDLLQTIPGIGPARAQRMVAERQRGPFKSLDDLHARVPGIGAKSVSKMAAAGLTVLTRPEDARGQSPQGVIYHVNR